MEHSVGVKRQLELKLENGHLRGKFFYNNWRDFARDLFILVSLAGFGHNFYNLQSVKTELESCQKELVKQSKQENQLPQPLPGENFFDYIQRISKQQTAKSNKQ